MTVSWKTLVRGFMVPAVALMACAAAPIAYAQSGAAPKPAAGAPPKPDEEVAVIDVTIDGKDAGRIVLQFYADVAPKHVENFKKIAKGGMYDGTLFHRVIPGFMIQGGDPNTKTPNKDSYGMGGPGWTVPAEFNPTPHKRGILSMARSNDPNSAGSQFFICVADAPFLDNKYTVFGKCLEGMDVADRIVALPRNERDLPKTPAMMKKVSIMKFSEVKKGNAHAAEKAEKATPK